MSNSKRPKRVTVLAVLFFIAASVEALLGLAYLIMTIFPIHGRYAGLDFRRHIGPFLVLILAVTLAVAGLGLWRLQKWGHRLATLLAFAAFLFQSLVMLFPRPFVASLENVYFALHVLTVSCCPPLFVSSRGRSVGFFSVCLMVYALVIVFLLLPDVRRAFAETSGSGTK